ncbi:putative sodium:solute symporter family protein [Leptospira ryugenii]|uniref:Putative sodium:solute symporter family protein n=1 Tax=Leptospira ryugenii TaxID=1917863 RepID=A0A2P2DV88_9LEPT|nr:sodium:solute symporter [Leptospira ryugenii]GBF48559.1 putative sodium:solute symporter family protein [Leptospira ryugenii]
MNLLLDLVIIIVYFLSVFALGLYFSKKKTSEEDFYLGKKEIHWVWLLFSLVATETSSLTFLSVPSVSFKSDLSFLQLAIGYILGRTIVAYFLLPSYFEGERISIYEYLGETYGPYAERSMSLVFTVSRILGDGIRLYVTSLPVAFLLQKSFGFQYSDIQIGIFSLAIISIVTIIYSVLGGFKAIVFTDSLQLIIYLIGGLYALFLLSGLVVFDEGTWAQISNKLTIFHLSFQEGDLAYYFLFAILGGAFISIGSHGTDLMLVQRVIASKQLSVARRVLVLSGVFVFLQFVLFLSIGILLYLYFQNRNIAPDKAFSYFIIEKIPSPFLGLLLSAIFASAMSTLSSTINSLSLTWARDWKLDRYLSPKSLSVLFGVILFLSSLFPFSLGEGNEKGVLEMGLTIFSYTLGPSIALFFFAKWKLAPNLPSLCIPIVLFSAIVLVFLLTQFWKLPFTTIIPVGILLFVGLIYFLIALLSLFSKIGAKPK